MHKKHKRSREKSSALLKEWIQPNYKIVSSEIEHKELHKEYYVESEPEATLSKGKTSTVHTYEYCSNSISANYSHYVAQSKAANTYEVKVYIYK